MSVDPLTEKYRDWAPYVFSGNRVIDSRELEGLEPITATLALEVEFAPETLAAESAGADFSVALEGMTVESVPRISTWESIGNFFGELWETVAGGSDVKTDLIPKNAMEQSIDKSKSNANEKTKLEDIPKPGKGKGSVAKADRDPKRTLTKKEKAEAIEERGGTCEGCNKEVTTETADAHHTERHADGGKTTKENTNILCKDCHKTIHK